LKILLTSTYFYPYLSGLTNYPLKLAVYWAKKYEVRVLTFQHDKKLSKEEAYMGFIIRRILVQFKIFKGLWNFFYPVYAWQELKKADIVFVNLPQFEGFVTAFWGKVVRKKLIVVYHCELAFDSGFLAKTAGWAGNVSAFASCFLADKIIAYTRDYAIHSRNVKKFLEKTEYILPPVILEKENTKYLDYLKKETAGYRPVLGFSGRIAREKAIEMIIEAVDRLKNKYPKALVLLAGPYGKEVAGEESYFKYIRELIKEKRIKAIFLGKLDKNKLSAFYQVCDFIVLPSLNKTEAFGMVQAEAMLSGKAVIASDLPGVRQPIKLTGMGELFKKGDVGDLTNKIDLVYKNKNNYIKKVDKAKKVFNIKKCFDFYEKILN